MHGTADVGPSQKIARSPQSHFEVLAMFIDLVTRNNKQVTLDLSSAPE